MENWKNITKWEEVEVKICPSNNSQWHVETIEYNVLIVGVECKQCQEICKHLHKSKVNQKNNWKVFQATRIAEWDQEGEKEFRDGLRLFTVVNITDAWENREWSDKQCYNFKFNNVTGLGENEFFSVFLVLSKIQEQVVINQEE